MKTRLLCWLVPLTCCAAALAADPLTEALQKGLLEEEVNHDFTAAARAYETAVRQADSQRQAAATAVFRLGETYRKLGKTNEAVAAYQRVVREYGSQTNLARLSRETLANLGAPERLPAATADQSGAEAGPSSADVETRRLAAQLDSIDRLTDDPEKQARAVLAFFPDEGLKRMLLNLPKLQAQAASFRDHPDLHTNTFRVAVGPDGNADLHWTEMTAADAQQEPKAQLAAIAERVQFILQTQRARLSVLQDSAATPASPAPARVVDAADVRSLQEEIKLVEQEVTALERKVENGKAGPEELRKTRRELLRLQRQLPENAGKERQTQLIQETLKLAEQDLEEVNKKISVGAAAPLDEVPIRREMLSLRRELAAAQRASATPAAGTDAGPAPTTNEEAAEIKRIRAIIQDSPDLVNAHNATGSGGTPLHKAAENGYVAVAEFLLANKADVNATDSARRTPLHRAAEQGHLRICELLLAKGANVNAADDVAYTPLHLAAKNGYRSVVQLLLAKGAQPNARGFVPPADRQPPAGDTWKVMASTPLHLVAESGFPELVDLLVAKGAEVDPTDRGGRTPLQRAVLRNQEATTRRLLDQGADVNATNGTGETALALADRARNVALARVLLDHKADLEARVAAPPPDGDWTALFEPVGRGERELTSLLLDRGANVNARAASGLTPVHWAVIQNAPTTLALLLARKPEVNVRDNAGNTPLHYAIEYARPELVEALLTAGADPNASGWTAGKTQPWWPLFKAVTLNADDTLRLGIMGPLLEHGADVNAKTSNHWTALHLAIQSHQTRLAEFLVDHKADVNAPGSAPDRWPELAVRAPTGAASSPESVGGPTGVPGRALRSAVPVTPAPLPGFPFSGATPAFGTTSFAADRQVTPLHVAVANQDLELTRYLLEHGADVNARDADGRTALHFAVDRRDLEMIRLLLDAKADPDGGGGNGPTPVGLATGLSSMRNVYSVQGRGNVMQADPRDIIALLRERGARVPPDPASILNVELTPSGQYRVAGKPTTLAELQKQLESPGSPFKSAQLVARGEEGARFKDLQDLLDLFKARGLSVTVSRQVQPRSIFDTDPEKAKAGGQVAFFGAVRANVFGLRGTEATKLSQALLEVGLTENASLAGVRVTRLNPDTGQPETRSVNLSGIRQGQPVDDLVLQDGDRVEVRKIQGN